MLEGKTILITGGTGSFGKRCCLELLRHHNLGKIIIFSRDELKQSEMAASPNFSSKKIRYFIGDVRDKDRLVRAMTDVDFVIHAAALKQVPAAEYNPHEFIKTNINGAMNVVDAAIAAKVKKVIALSTDKAVNPINLYGATKLCSDKVFTSANNYSGRDGTRFSIVRYGNVIGSRGSVVPLFIKQRENGTLTLTKPEMTRFVIMIGDGVNFALRSLNDMVGGEVFIPKLPSCSLENLAKAIAPEAKIKEIGLRPGEKLHEALLPEDESNKSIEQADRYIIHPSLPYWNYTGQKVHRGKPCPTGFSYSSETNPEQLSVEQIRELIDRYQLNTLD
ncbi:UDP-N-acetylglucosamine 4,6-dehydratase (inverting) [Pelagicoccus sp. SDUM812003]|uniref:UDP-N-acetylglucosamine 4,6-dehydratase (inverting) n=1 Tax=Pelagicoccus sp. SDUM812003 TaxID=3041267 RepID=UPI00280F4BB6|nr:UDP-N-acetylglucosamine 4,6-dehydratase (inverting) [Pelagicoccus sp. SDUM812003]MDQ8201544.1 UDP-N-acetylglucosamine 4,6-dehydratase (inverting) [Pelagicoccus sp. SDUM812003]